jgi:hypothetical protein
VHLLGTLLVIEVACCAYHSSDVHKLLLCFMEWNIMISSFVLLTDVPLEGPKSEL